MAGVILLAAAAESMSDHLFLDGTGPPTPTEYQKPGHVDPAVIATIAAWITGTDAAARHA